MDTSSGSYRPSKNAWLAVGLSAAAPGLGQLYDESYWKIPVIWGLGGYWIAEWIQMNRNYQDYRDQYLKSFAVSPAGDNHLLSVRNFYRDERDKFAWYLGALYVLNLVDAYVGAQLYDFDVGPDLSGRLSARVRLRLR